MSTKQRPAASEPIAITGMGCRFPGGASDPETFWGLLRSGADAITEVPPSRWDVDAVYDANPAAPGKIYTRWGGFLAEGIDGFDADFFSVSPREAPAIDPQHRLFLEVCFEALESAGEPTDRLAGSRSGVFAGIFAHEYAELLARDPERLDAYTNVGASGGALAGRVSYTLGLRGPSFTVDTASSSSLVAVHLAAESLRAGKCDLALAGGVNLILTPTTTIGFCRAGAMSPDGRCRVFDAAANGYVRSEGCGVVVLKRLSDALAANDRIFAVIRGTAVNQDGASDGLMAPSGDAQEELLRLALDDAGATPAQVSYLEAHGTGTPLGDHTETRAIAAVYGGDDQRAAPLVVGSVKTQLGHLESAAGIAGLIKVVLSLQHGEIPANLHFHELHPSLPLPAIPAEVPTALRAWPRPSGARLAGVSSFGFSGTNAHVLIEEAPEAPAAAGPTRGDRPLHLLALSAKNEAALVDLAARHAAQPAIDLADLCHTVNRGRAHHRERLAITAGSADELRARLRAFEAGELPAGVYRGQARGPVKVAFLFTGGGAQYAGMGRTLYATQPTFRAALDACAAILRAHLVEPLLSVLWGERTALLNRMDYMQPALFAVEYAMSALWRSWGVEPAAVIGHSLGEFVAATVAGALSLEDGLLLIAKRAQLMHSAPEAGAMASLAASEARVHDVLSGRWPRVAIGAVNGPESTLISGDRGQVLEALQRFEAQGVKVKLLPISHASHSPLMEPILDAFEEAVARVAFSAPRIPVISNLTGGAIAADELARPRYWRRHLREAVRFADGVRALFAAGCTAYVEMGPGAALAGMAEDCAPAELRGLSVYGPSIRKDRDEWEQLLETVGRLYTAGATIDWAGFDRDYPRRKVAAPTYPFQRRPYWVGHAPESAPAPAPRRSARPAARPESLRAIVEGELARALGRASMEGIDASRPFKELGVDSLMSRMLRARLVERLGAHLEDKIPPTVLFSRPNLAALAEFLAGVVTPPKEATVITAPEPTATAGLHEPIAIVGLGCRFPGTAEDPASFWRLLESAGDAITLVPKDRWDLDALYDADPFEPGKIYSRWGGFLRQPIELDARAYGLSKVEARSMDPQQKLVLAVSWEALASAGIPLAELKGSQTGVFLGAWAFDHGRKLNDELESINSFTLTGSSGSIIAGRVSYLLGLHGPAMVVDTACSSSLVAVHLACQSLRAGESDLALAGGVNVILDPRITVGACKTRMLSPEGRCKSFDASADGYVRSEGCGVLVLKRLADAVRDGNRIQAVIRGTAINQDGASNGLTAPNGEAQEALLRRALADGGVRPSEIQFLEAHGSGTALGDPIEIQAARAVLGAGRGPDQPLTIGAVKTNLGHLEAASGVAGVVKVVLSLQHEQMVPNLHLKEVNPLLELEKIPARIATELVPWTRGGRRRFAGVSAFGFSGTNAHLVIEEAP